jgi:hypothetical protein
MFVRSRNTFLLMMSVFLISACILALELLLMRSLAITSFHHFSYLVISIALLGFGASGICLFLFYRVFQKRFWRIASWGTCLFSLSSVLCFQSALSLPLDIQYVLFNGKQALLLFLYPLFCLIPFFLGALVIGLAIIKHNSIVHYLYSVNLFGSGFGSCLIIFLMFLFPLEYLFYCVAILAILAAVLLAWAQSSERKSFTDSNSIISSGIYKPFLPALISFLLILISYWFIPLKLFPDTCKDLSLMQNLERQNDAFHVISRFSPRAELDVFDSPVLHNTLFVSLAAKYPPPKQMALLSDGNILSTLFIIKAPEDARILTFTPTELAYRLIHPKSVLLLGETGGADVWLARLHGAQKITIVQSNPQVFDLIVNSLQTSLGHVFEGKDIRLVASEPRIFLENTRDRFDLIKIVSMESPAAGVSGRQSLHENYLMTIEGIAQALLRLQPHGILTVTRGLQSPPRDNVKILSTFIGSLENIGIVSPSDHIIQIRHYLAACTLVSSSPFSDEQLKELRAFCEELYMDIVWAPDVRPEELNRFDVRGGPPGETFCYYHYAARQLFQGEKDRFYRSWAYNVKPATDDKPYFYDFFKWRSLPEFVKAYGNRWFQRLELGYVVLIISLLESLVIAGLLIILPLFLGKNKAEGKIKKPVFLVYFALLGISYIMIEMVMIQKFIFFLGDPIYSAILVLTGFLIFSGWGSLSARKSDAPLEKTILKNIAVILIVGVLFVLFLDPVLKISIHLPLGIRIILSLLLMMPLAFHMGRPFPLGISLLNESLPGNIPMAWAINGFFSVIAATLAIILSMSFGFMKVILLALFCYMLAGTIIHLYISRIQGMGVQRSAETPPGQGSNNPQP